MPIKGPQLASYIASRNTKKKGHCQVCRVPRPHKEQFMQTLIVRLWKTLLVSLFQILGGGVPGFLCLAFTPPWFPLKFDLRSIFTYSFFQEMASQVRLLLGLPDLMQLVMPLCMFCIGSILLTPGIVEWAKRVCNQRRNVADSTRVTATASYTKPTSGMLTLTLTARG